MKRITSLFALLLLSVVTAMAAQEEITVTPGNATYATSGGNYVSSVTFSSTPVLTVTASANNMDKRQTGDYLLWHSGTSRSSTYTISVPEGYTISAYSVTGEANTAVQTLTAGSISHEFAVGTSSTFTVSDLSSETTSFVQTGNNESGLKITQISVTVIKATDEQIAAAEKVNSWLGIMQGQALVTDASNYSSNALQTNDGGGYPALLDKNTSTFFHSQYSGTNPGTYHYLQANLGESVDGFYFYTYKRNNNNRPNEILIQGSNDGTNFTDITTVSGDQMVANDYFYSDKISATTDYQYLRFVVKNTNTGATFGDYVFFTYSEFWILPSNEATDAAIAFIKEGKSASALTDDEIAQINQIDQDLRSTTVEVTYELYKSDGTTLITSETVTQSKNSEVNIPANMKQKEYYFNYVTEGTIGTSDCTIKVTRTLKDPTIVEDLANLSNNKAYYITTNENKRKSLSTYAANENIYLASDSKNNLNIAPKKFAIINYEDNLYLYSVEDGKFVLSGSGEQIALADKVTGTTDRVTFMSTADPLFMPKFNDESNKVINTSDSYTYAVVVNSWGSSTSQWDDGCQYTIHEADDFDPANAIGALDEVFHPSYTITYIVKDEAGETLFTSEPVGTTAGTTITTLPAEFQRPAFYTYNEVNVTISETSTPIEFTATLKEDAPVKFTADAANPFYYNLKIRNKYLVRSDDNTVPNQDASEPFNPAASWAFIGEPYAGFCVINKAAGSSLNLMYSNLYDYDFRNEISDVNFVTMRDDAADKKWFVETNNSGFVLRAKENTNVYLHQRDANGLSTCSVNEWSYVHDDPGSTIIASTDEDVLVQLYELLKALPIGTNLNQYSAGDNDVEAILAILARVGSDIDNSNTSNYADDYATLKALQEALTLNMPEAGKFLRIFSVAQDGYVSSTVDESVEAPWNTYFTDNKAQDDKTTIWFYDGSNLLNYATGLYTTGAKAAEVGATSGDTYTFETATNGIGKYWIKPSNQNYWFGGTPTLDYWSNPAGKNECLFTLEYVTELPITLTEVDGLYYATFSAPVDIVEITGATLHKISVVEDKYVKYEEANATGLPANTGVLLISDTSGEATATIGEYTGDAVETNLSAQIASVTGSDGLFFGKGADSGKLGFFALADGMATKGFKAFVANETAGGAKGLEFIDNEATGIDSINNSQFTIDNGAIYNLQGQKVNKAQKGVFIQNGRKVVVK